MAKVLCVLYDDPVGGHPAAYPRDGLPALAGYPDGQTLPTPGGVDFTPGELLGSVSGELGLRPFLEAGRDIFNRRQGQLDIACAQCHNDHWSERLGGSPITQAQPTGYPIYRLEWQSLGSLQRRMRNCIVGMRAEAYPFGAPEYVDLELYLMWRARGMKLETPAVRP